MSSLLKQLNEIVEAVFEVETKQGAIRYFSPMTGSYCSDGSKANDISAAQYGAGRRQSRAGCNKTYRNRVRGRKAQVACGGDAYQEKKGSEKVAEIANSGEKGRSTES